MIYCDQCKKMIVVKDQNFVSITLNGKVFCKSFCFACFEKSEKVLEKIIKEMKNESFRI